MRVRIGILLFAAVTVPFGSGCYAFVRVDAAESSLSGRRFALDLTDRGRVALSERLGEGIARLEGTLTQRDSNQYVMSVWRVAQLNGERTPWSGESVRVDRSFVSGIYERRLSRGRSYLAAGLAVAALVYFANRQGLFGSADAEGEPDPPPIPPQAMRKP